MTTKTDTEAAARKTVLEAARAACNKYRLEQKDTGLLISTPQRMADFALARTRELTEKLEESDRLVTVLSECTSSFDSCTGCQMQVMLYRERYPEALSQIGGTK